MYRHFLLHFFATLFFCLPLFAQEFDELNNQAYKERDNKNFKKAIELSTQSINKKVNARAYIIRADSRYELGDYETAIDDFSSSLTYYSDYYADDNKEKGGILYFRGRSKHKLGRYDDAISDYNSALYYNYSEPGYVYWNRGACYYQTGKYKEADDDYLKAIDRISGNEDLSILYEDRGDCQAQLANYETAYALYVRAISYNSNNYNPYWQRGHYKSIEGKYEEALADFNKAIEIITTTGSSANNNDLAILYRNKALMNKYQKQYDQALASINKSVETDPNIAKTYRVRGDIYQAMKKYDKAKADYGNSIILQTDKKIKAEIYLDRSMMEWNILDYKSCLDDLNKAVELDPGYGMYYWHRSLVNGYKKNYPAAIKECNAALDLYKNDSSSTASLFWLRASHKDNAGDYKGAAEDYQTYLKYYPDNYSGYYELGRLFRTKMKNNDLASANLAKAAVLAEKEGDTIKYCYIKVLKGDKAEAITRMLQLVEKAKDDKDSYKNQLHNMTCIYALAGNTAKALEYLDKSLAAGYDYYLHLVNDKDLLSLMKLPQWKTILVKYKVPVPKV